MKTAFFILIVLVVLFFSCTPDKTSEIRIINPGGIIEKRITLSEIANEIVYITLSDEILFGNVNAELTDSLIFIKPRSEGLLTFDFKGRFKSRIGKKGRGPGEYISASKLTLDTNNKAVYILDAVNGKILKFSMKGDFLNEIQIPNMGQQFFSKIVYLNNKLYLYEGINQGSGKYNWIVLDTIGNLLYEKFNHIQEFSSYHGFIGNKQEAYDHILYYWNQINDTIFKINGEKYEPAFLFAKGEFRFPKQKIRKVSTQYFYPRRIFFTKSYLFFSYNYQYANCTGIYIKSEQQLYEVSKSMSDDFFLGPGIMNDIDGGLPLIPISYFQNDNNEEFLIGEIKPFELKSYLVSDAFKNSTPKYPEKKKELEKLANSLDENDNPVLMLVKLKE